MRENRKLSGYVAFAGRECVQNVVTNWSMGIKVQRELKHTSLCKKEE
jgi:hypothetical protein